MLHLEHSAILWTFIKLPILIKIFVLSIFERPVYTGFTVFIPYVMDDLLASVCHTLILVISDLHFPRGPTNWTPR